MEQKTDMEELTKEELDKLVQDSTEIMNNFKLYLAVFASGTKQQAYEINKEQYEKMQKTKFISSMQEQDFFKDLPNNDTLVDVRTAVLTKDNIGLAFYPLVWKSLKLEQRLAVCRMVRLTNEKKDFTEFCQNNSSCIVMAGDKYNGVLNISSLKLDKLIGSDFLIAVLNTLNTIKGVYYTQKLLDNQDKYKKITDYKTLEELRYLSPIQLDNIDNATSKGKALYYDNIEDRRYRRALQLASDLLFADAEVMEGLLPDFDESLIEKQFEIRNIEKLILQELGYSRKQRDEEYLQTEVLVFNDREKREYNKKVDIYNEKYDQIKNAKDMLEVYMINQELLKLKKKLDKETPKIVTFEQVKKHFAADLKDKPVKIKPVKVKKNSKQNVEENEKNELN